MRFAEKFRSGSEGFTLIELLVVVIILGILAAIAIPTFLAQREQAQDADAKSTVRNAATAIITFNLDRGSYPLGNAANVTEMGEIQPTINWRASQNTLVSLNSDAMIGAVPFERIGTGVVFGTRSASGECFYMRIDANGTRYGHDSQCNDPYETSNEGRIADTGW